MKGIKINPTACSPEPMALIVFITNVVPFEIHYRGRCVTSQVAIFKGISK